MPMRRSHTTDFVGAISPTPSLPSTPSAPKEKVILEGVEETLMAAIWCRAKDAQSANPLLGDPYAQYVLDRCEVDYTRSTFASLQDERYGRFIAGRGKEMDAWCVSWLESHGDNPCQVLQLACGIDSRAYRIKRGPNVRWIDLDKPLVTNLRQRLYTEPPEGDYCLRSLSVTNEHWLGDIPQDRPTLVIAEGLLMYLKAEQSKKVIKDVVNYFDLGGQMIFDVLGTILQKYSSQISWLKSSGATYGYGVDEPSEVLALHSELRLLQRQYWHEYMQVERKVSCAPPWFGQKITKVAAVLPSFNDFGQIMQFEWDDRDERRRKDSTLSRPDSTLSSRPASSRPASSRPNSTMSRKDSLLE